MKEKVKQKTSVESTMERVVGGFTSPIWATNVNEAHTNPLTKGSACMQQAARACALSERLSVTDRHPPTIELRRIT